MTIPQAASAVSSAPLATVGLGFSGTPLKRSPEQKTTLIRVATFRRSRFNHIELELWRKRTNVAFIFRVEYTDTRCRVTYK